MTVKELIDALKEFDENTEVLGFYSNMQDAIKLVSVTPYVGMDDVTIYPSLNMDYDDREL